MKNIFNFVKSLFFIMLLVYSCIYYKSPKDSSSLLAEEPLAEINTQETIPVEENTSMETEKDVNIETVVDPFMSNLDISEPMTEDTTLKEMIYFSEDITFSYEYIKSENKMPYGLFTPSTASEFEKIPLIVWLHGSGEKESSEANFASSGLLGVLNNWNLEGFNAYVLCPHIKTPYYTSTWNKELAQTYLTDILDEFVETHNVDTNKIIIAGHSLGAQGALYFAQTMPDYFSAMVPLSVYHPCVQITNTDIPVKCYVGTIDCGEDSLSVSYTFDGFCLAYGESAINSIRCGHGELPKFAFTIDNDKNNRSDLIEWMLTQEKNFELS